MGFFSTRRKSPPTPLSTEDFVLWVAREDFGIRDATLDSALDQDLKIIGDDVDDFAEVLAERYGEWVADWPWERFVCLDEGVLILAPMAAIWDFLRLPWGDTAIPRKPELERLTLAHVANVLERGEWIDP
ncbi:hypothetical protein [Qipengyuania sp. S6317L1]|uniref:hypothetical protein n=1 Tax=Qipengyuania sp. S6317L1 TaxID=2926410 RepID=UPI001FF275B5|nr:hypothetical protein [Qipengyuania sp. S6317L1]